MGGYPRQISRDLGSLVRGGMHLFSWLYYTMWGLSGGSVGI